MDPLLKDWITIGFSSAALIISCSSFVLSWRNFRRDRSHLKFTISFVERINLEGQYQVTITNDGRRTATLVKVNALLWFRKSHTVFRQETVLTEGKPKVIFVPLAMIPSISNPLSVRAFEAEDSVGHKYRAGTLNLLFRIAKRNR